MKLTKEHKRKLTGKGIAQSVFIRFLVNQFREQVYKQLNSKKID